jgi:hypothetical protein
MIPRELPSHLKVAYSLRYADEPNTGNCLSRIANVVKRTFALIKELINYRPCLSDFKINIEKLNRAFEKINKTVQGNQKPLCVYFVSSQDHNGAILGDHLYYYHHYKIQGLQKHFAVAPMVVSSQEEMKNFMTSLRDNYPQREIKFVDVVTHGGKSSLEIHPPRQGSITPDVLREDLFSDCASDATILLDACITGLGDRNIADEIARITPGRTVLAPGPSLYFSKPVIKVTENNPRVVSAVHGFAIFNAYECKSFLYSEKQVTQYPYLNENNLKKDILLIAESSLLQNTWLDRFVKSDRNDYKTQIGRIYNGLSESTQAMIIQKLREKNENFDGNFVLNDPLNPHVLWAFRSIFKELVHEVREYPQVKTAKIGLVIRNILEVIKEFFRDLTYREALAPPQPQIS